MKIIETTPTSPFSNSAPDIYANTVIVWYSPHEFTLDCGIQPDHPEDDALVVAARIRIPPTAIFRLASTISTRIGEYEAIYGGIVPDPGIEVPDGFLDYGPDDGPDEEGESP